MKIYDLPQLVDFATREVTWRIREISDFRLSFANQTRASKAAQARAGVPLLYAHWEGYAKNCTIAYVQLVSSRRKRLDELGAGFWLAALRAPIDQLIARPFDKRTQMMVVDHVRQSGDRRFSSRAESIVDTKSNLSFSALQEMGSVVDVNINALIPEESFIDKVLLDRRNNIAHGQDVAIDENEFMDMSNRTIDIMRTYGNCVVDAAQRLLTN